MFIIKLGGSVITKKSEFATYNEKIMDNLALQIKNANKECIIIHGAGSFGHVLAKEHKLHKGYENDAQKIGFAKTHYLVQQLNSYVLHSLQSVKIPAISLPPHAMVQLNNTKLESINDKLFQDYIALGFTPITYGDVALDRSLGFSICSGDVLLLTLAKIFRPEKTIFVIDEDGLYTKNPKKHDDAKFIESIHSKKMSSLVTSLDNHADVTQGMEGKINTINQISQLHIDTVLLNGNKPDRLFEVLTDKKTICTVVKG